MTTKWSKQWPQEDGWYWVRYIGKNGMVVCPARLTNLSGIQCVHTARNDSFFSHTPKDVRNIAFGQRIQEP